MARAGITFTYEFDPSETRRDAVRFLIGDIDAARPLLDDKEISNATDKYPSDLRAAAFLCDGLVKIFARESDVKVGPVSKSLSKVSDQYRKAAEDLRTEANKLVAPSFPAVFVSEKETLHQDSSLVRPQFAVGQGDDPWVLQLGTDLNEARRGCGR